MAERLQAEHPERITFKTKASLKKKAKIAAVKKNQTLTEFITSILEEKLNKQKYEQRIN